MRTKKERDKSHPVSTAIGPGLFLIALMFSSPDGEKAEDLREPSPSLPAFLPALASSSVVDVITIIWQGQCAILSARAGPVCDPVGSGCRVAAFCHFCLQFPGPYWNLCQSLVSPLFGGIFITVT